MPAGRQRNECQQCVQCSAIGGSKRSVGKFKFVFTATGNLNVLSNGRKPFESNSTTRVVTSRTFADRFQDVALHAGFQRAVRSESQQCVQCSAIGWSEGSIRKFELFFTTTRNLKCSEENRLNASLDQVLRHMWLSGERKNRSKHICSLQHRNTFVSLASQQQRELDGDAS